MSPLNKKQKSEITTHLTKSIQKLLDSPELKELSEAQIEHIARSVYLDSLKDELKKEVKKAQMDSMAIDRYTIQWLSGFQSKHTVRSFKTNLNYFLQWLNGTSILDVNALVVDKYVSFLNSDKKTSDNTKRQRIAACSSFFSDLQRWSVIGNNPFKGIKGLPKKKIAVKEAEQIPSNKELDLLEQYALSQIVSVGSKSGRGLKNKETGNLYAYISLKILRAYGLRVGALQGIKIDRDGNFKTKSKGHEVHGKFDSDILELLNSSGLSHKEPFKEYTESAFSMCLWRAQSSDELNAKFKRKYSAHGIRHRFSIDYYNRTKDVNELSKRLGHSSLLVTTAYLAGLKIDSKR